MSLKDIIYHDMYCNGFMIVKELTNAVVSLH